MANLVSTPGGSMLASNVHSLKEEERLFFKDGSFKKISNTGNIITSFAETDPSFRPMGQDRNKIRDLSTDKDGWIIYSGWKNEGTEPISYFRTEWVVPDPPTNDNGQVIYIFMSIENSDYTRILQPVLQWGVSPAGGGDYWAVTNWFVGTPGSGITCHKPLVRVEPGEVIKGLITLKSHSGNRYDYLSSFEGEKFIRCHLHIDGIDQLTWASETLECYRMSDPSHYPNTLLTAMTDVEIRLRNNIQAQLKWKVYNKITNYGQHCLIATDGSPKGHVKLCYK